MKIGIDARLIEETGVGRYITNLIGQLSIIDTNNQYVVFLRKKSFDSFKVPNSKWHKVLAETAWHTLKEQIVMPGILLREHLDLLHVPYFNVPIFYPKSYIVTIHDLTILHINTGKATKLPLPIYWLKRAGYYFISLIGLARAKHIVAVSNATKQEIMDHFAINENNITVTHEGVEEHFKNLKVSKGISAPTKDPYFLYVGNAYPHKNIEVLIEAFRIFKAKHSGNIQLILVGNDDIFYARVKNIIKKKNLEDAVIFFGSAHDDELKQLYKNAIAFVFPSIMEGFGLPGLEAMAIGTPVICSDIPVFHEIYKDAALYFDTYDVHALTRLLEAAFLKEDIVQHNVKRGHQRVTEYSWKQMAKDTVGIYTSFCK